MFRSLVQSLRSTPYRVLTRGKSSTPPGSPDRRVADSGNLRKTSEGDQRIWR